MTSQDDDIDRLIDELERAVFQRRTKEGVQLLLNLLQAMSLRRSPLGILPQAPAEDRRAAYTRIAAMISALICSPDFQIDLGQIDFLSGRKPMLEAIFELSGYEGPYHLLRYNGIRNADDSVTLRSNQVFVLSLFYSLDALPDSLIQGVLKLPPDQLLPLVVGWFTAPFVHHARGEANRSLLIENCHLIEGARPTPGIIQAMTSAWMHCSYADHAGKHRVKQSLNEVWRRLDQIGGLKGRSAPRRVVEHPTLLVAAERMTNGHAMLRSYAACWRQLKSKFRTVCMVSAGFATPEVAEELFDDVVYLEEGVNMKDIGARIVKMAPDIIYYPSLGMSEWTQMVANLRFSPIQVMTLGHPAPAMTDTIDYTLVQLGHGEAAHEFGAKVIERSAWGQFIPFDESLDFDFESTPFEDGRVHVAVNSSLMKLSPRFLNLCERIETEASRPVHFHFFASASGVMFDRIKQVFERRFRRFTLEPSRNYAAFLKTLKRCDVALAAFPFGNTNSTVDTCLLGVPTVAYFANEVLSIGDRDVMRMVGLPSWLVSDNDEDYFQTAMKLIHDDVARQAIVDQLKATDVKAKLFRPPRPEDETEFVDAFDWIYRNHEALQASSHHLLKVGEPIPA
ncbi:hypothetical protein [Roseateles paludis]|jgi:hypothetical protein|uniref:Adhesin n=1 Tax=Roseateles paludis TaxID=3145238 RepID=A0ABV0G6E4_9BURK